jgi:peptidoglycan hydrolase CwlO-like protein
MKRLFILMLPLVLLGGCASMWKTLGVATVKSVGEVQASVDELKAGAAQISTLRQSLDELSAAVDENKAALAEIERLKESVSKLQDRADQLPRETIQQLAEILSKAAKELSASAGGGS